MSEPVEERKLSQSSDKMFERNVAILASKGREVILSVNDENSTGFLAGLDERYVQLCRSSNGRLVLFTRSQIFSVEETGLSLEQIDPPELKQKIRERVGNFMQIAQSHTRKS